MLGTGTVAAANVPGRLTDADILIDAAQVLQAARTFLAQQQAVSISIISAMGPVRGCRNAAERSLASALPQSESRSCITWSASLMAILLSDPSPLTTSL